jgi:hypothetical protein
VKRQFYWIGRAGTLLLVVGIALTLVSLMPPSGDSTTGGSGRFPPKNMDVLSFPNLITPQQQIMLTVDADQPILIHILEVGESYFRGWIMERFPDLLLDGVVIGGDNSSLIALEAFLDAHSDSAIFNVENKTISWEFTPKRVMNTTAIMANPSDLPTSYEYNVEMSTILAPKGVVLPQALILIIIGILISVPWTLSTISTKRPRSEKK